MVINKPKKRIWYISHYVAPPEYDTHSRAIKFSEALIRSGYEVTIFSSAFLHNKGISLIEDNKRFIKNTYDNLNFVHIKTVKYKGYGLFRIFALIQFSLSIFFLRNKFEKPDIIIHTAQVPFENLIYFVAKKLKAEYLIEVLDLWPESFVEYGILSQHNPVMKIFYKTEKWLYKKADKVIFSMEGGKDYLFEKGWSSENGGPVDIRKVYYINNGVDIHDFDFNKDHFRLDDPELVAADLFKVIYIGSIRLANNMKLLIEAASLLRDYPEIRFLIYGDGNERSSLEAYCKINNIVNVSFKNKWIEMKFIPFVLSHSSLNILNYKPSKILRYGGSQGKLFQYLASGKPICSNQKMGYCPIVNNNIGISEDFATAEEYAQAILSFYKMDKASYDIICKRVRAVALNFDYNILADKFVKLFE